MSVIPFLRPSLPGPEEWLPLLTESFETARFSNFGPLEREFAKACATRYAFPGYEVVTVSSATMGLVAALLTVPRPMDRRPRVALPAFTFPATLHAALQAGFDPVLCDVDPVTWELDPRHLRTLADRGPLDAVIPVRSYGFVRDQGPILDIAAQLGARVIVDGAAAFGHEGRLSAIGSPAGEIEVVSLHATKSFAVGEGGLVFVPPSLASHVIAATNFGFGSSPGFGDGGNMKLDEFHAAVGLAVLRNIDAQVQARAALAAEYRTALAPFSEDLQLGTSVGPTPWQCFPVHFGSVSMRDRVEQGLEASGVATRRYYSPSLAAGYKGSRVAWFDPADTPHAELLSTEMLCLPIYVGMSDAERDQLFGALQQVVCNAAGRVP